MLIQVFSNSVKRAAIEKLAEVDDNQVIQQVEEYFADYIAVNTGLFTLNQSRQYLT